MAGGINKIELVGVAVPGMVIERDTLGLDSNATLPLYVHRIENLSVHFTSTQTATMLDETICQRGLAVVNMGDYGKIADMSEVTHSIGPICSAEKPDTESGLTSKKREIVPQWDNNRYAARGELFLRLIALPAEAYSGIFRPINRGEPRRIKRSGTELPALRPLTACSKEPTDFIG